MAKISLSTYTFNDASLVNGLLAAIPSWTVIPDEIVITDDGSETPFVPDACYPSSLPAPRILRLDENMGFTNAKHTGVGATTGEVFISMDSDARPDPNFLECCLAHLKKPEVGMAGGNSLVSAGPGSIGQYLRLYGDNYTVSETGPVEFIPGPAWAMRRAVWDEVGGFSSHTRRNCGDRALCALLRKKGYQLIADANTRVFQVRRLTRHIQMRRIWLWCGPPLASSIVDEASLPDQLMAIFGKAIVGRAENAAELQSLILLYYELLMLPYLAFEFCAYPGLWERLPVGMPGRLFAALEEKLAAYPRLWRLLQRDLTALRVLPLQAHPTLPEKENAPPLGTRTDWSSCLSFIDSFAQSGALNWLNTEGMRILLEEDAERQSDFSAYLKAKPI